MSLPGLKELCLEQLVASAERFVERQWADGRFELTPEHDTDAWNQYHQQFILPAALLYSLDHPANPWHENERMWAAILRNGRHLVSQVDAEGAMLWRSHGKVFLFSCQRLLCAWLLAYERLEGRLPAEEERVWREAILRGSEWIFRCHVSPRRDTQRFTAHDDGVGTGTNHFALYLSLLYRLGNKWDRPEWVEITADLMRRLIAAQQPGGYWAEHHGPALGYNYLTYHGVDEYAAWSGDEAGLSALRAGLALHQAWTYPDGTPIECIDGRMRHLARPMLWGLAGFSRWPEGRGYARFLLEQTRGTTLSGEDAARLAEAYMLLQEGAEELPLPKQHSYRALLEGVSVVRKEGPWVVALSGHCSPNWEANVFILDRQALVSLWQEGSGLILDGGNSKRQPELATFCCGSGASADALPLSAAPLPAQDGEEAVKYRYASFDAAVRARIVGPGAVDLAVSAPESRGKERVVMTLVPAAAFGESILLETRGKAAEERKLGTDGFTFAVREHGGALSFRGVRMLLPGGAWIQYPVSPFNSYSVDNSSPPGANRVVVRCLVDKEGVAFRLQAAR